MNLTNDRVFELAKRVIDPRYRDSLTQDSRLFEEHILDSFGLIQLVVEIDNEFSIAIKTEDLTSQNFSTISDIAALVESYITSGQ